MEDSSSHPTTINDSPSGPSLSTLDTPSQPHHNADTTSTPQAKHSFLSVTSDNDEDDTSSTQPVQCNFFFFQSVQVLTFLTSLLSFTANKWRDTGSSFQDKCKCTSSVNELDLEDSDDEYSRKKGMNF